MSTLVQRCRQWLEGPAGSDPAVDMADFVLSEIGRAADTGLEQTAPLVLYFTKEEDRAEFLAMMVPGMIERKWP